MKLKCGINNIRAEINKKRTNKKKQIKLKASYLKRLIWLIKLEQELSRKDWNQDVNKDCNLIKVQCTLPASLAAGKFTNITSERGHMTTDPTNIKTLWRKCMHGCMPISFTN